MPSWVCAKTVASKLRAITVTAEVFIMSAGHAATQMQSVINQLAVTKVTRWPNDEGVPGTVWNNV